MLLAGYRRIVEDSEWTSENRISEIQDVTSASQWRHVPGKMNPADKGTRGLKSTELVDDQVWWHGPSFLQRGMFRVASKGAFQPKQSTW